MSLCVPGLSTPYTTMTIELQAQPAPDGSKAASFTPPPITSLVNVAYLVGHPIAHSSSPKLHDTVSSFSGIPYAQILAETVDLESFMGYLRTHPPVPRLLGSGVTMPHKVSVSPYLDHLTPEAQAVGAVNTIFLRNNNLGEKEFWGTNTDTIGIRDAFLKNLSDEVVNECRGKPGLIVGGGGTCRAAIYALERYLGCSNIYIINRDRKEVEGVIRDNKSELEIRHITSKEEVEGMEGPGLVISAIPDFEPVTPPEREVRDILELILTRQPEEARGAVLEMCYHPSPDTRITRLAEGCGWKVIGGLEAMIAQGLEQAKLWAGVEVDEKLRTAAKAAVIPR
jgi:quinate dehydrogenase